jgi:ribose 1,5-bisphosphokinase PhnN
VDDVVVRTARQFDAHGHLVTVISPDPTGDDTVGHTLARVERGNRISALRRAGVRVLDWGEESLATELARAERRWNR